MGRILLSIALLAGLVPVGSQGHYDHPARDDRALASCWISSLLALEVPQSRRPTANSHRIAGIDPTNEH
jgi:hypothetical protein